MPFHLTHKCFQKIVCCWHPYKLENCLGSMAQTCDLHIPNVAFFPLNYTQFDKGAFFTWSTKITLFLKVCCRPPLCTIRPPHGSCKTGIFFSHWRTCTVSHAFGAALLYMLNAIPNQKNGRFSILREMSDSNEHTVVKRLLAIFKTAALPIRLNLPGAACLYFYIQNAYWTLGPCGMLPIPWEALPI